jgi:hypothetical protein
MRALARSVGEAKPIAGHLPPSTRTGLRSNPGAGMGWACPQLARIGLRSKPIRSANRAAMQSAARRAGADRGTERHKKDALLRCRKNGRVRIIYPEHPVIGRVRGLLLSALIAPWNITRHAELPSPSCWWPRSVSRDLLWDRISAAACEVPPTAPPPGCFPPLSSRRCAASDRALPPTPHRSASTVAC